MRFPKQIVTILFTRVNPHLRVRGKFKKDIIIQSSSVVDSPPKEKSSKAAHRFNCLSESSHFPLILLLNGFIRLLSVFLQKLCEQHAFLLSCPHHLIRSSHTPYLDCCNSFTTSFPGCCSLFQSTVHAKRGLSLPETLNYCSSPSKILFYHFIYGKVQNPQSVI